MHKYRMSGTAAARHCWRTAALLLLSWTLTVATPQLGSNALAQVPGPELFAKEPRTPIELWDAIDYLLRTNQAKKALPYLDRFVKDKPDDATLSAIRIRYGAGSILRLSDHAATRPYAQPLAEAMVTAAHKYATRPERVARFVGELTKTPQEQSYAVRHLREAGADAIPFLVDALSRVDLSVADRRLIVTNMGRLNRSAIPALIAVLDSKNQVLACDAATALGMIGDKEAIPFLMFSAASTQVLPSVRTAAQEAIARLTRRPFTAQIDTPTQVLTQTAWRYHRHKIEFADDPTTVWQWDNQRNGPVARHVALLEAESVLGLRLSSQALQLDPANHDANVVHTSLLLEQAIARLGFNKAAAGGDPEAFASAKACGSFILSDVLKTAIADKKTDLAALTASALGQITNRDALAAAGRLHPLVDALYAPGRRVQFAAARALASLAPAEPFPGSSRIIPVLRGL